ncbi:hypothetical protein QQP08_025072 [Theobroma cacao]|nr:hypothetical protein QQP08_025072 [Theobroma cacao]
MYEENVTEVEAKESRVSWAADFYLNNVIVSTFYSNVKIKAKRSSYSQLLHFLNREDISSPYHHNS